MDDYWRPTFIHFWMILTNEQFASKNVTVFSYRGTERPLNIQKRMKLTIHFWMVIIYFHNWMTLTIHNWMNVTVVKTIQNWMNVTVVNTIHNLLVVPSLYRRKQSKNIHFWMKIVHLLKVDECWASIIIHFGSGPLPLSRAA